MMAHLQESAGTNSVTFLPSLIDDWSGASLIAPWKVPLPRPTPENPKDETTSLVPESIKSNWPLLAAAALPEELENRLIKLASVPKGWGDGAGAAYGRGDYATALTLLEPLAEQGNVYAQYTLGVMYVERQGGLPQDYFQAVAWFRKAAEMLDATTQTNGPLYQAAAQNALGNMYQLGKGVAQDYVQAHMWFNLSEQGYDFGNRDALASHMTPDQIAEAQKLASDWLAAHPKPSRPWVRELSPPRRCG